MRARLIILPLLLCCSPALAQGAPGEANLIQVPPELADPATADRLSDAMQELSKVLLDLKVGGVQAALEGRQPTAAERRLTVRDMSKVDDKELQRRIAAVKPAVRQSINSINAALPEIMRNLDEAQKSLERATANLPDPTYPRR